MSSYHQQEQQEHASRWSEENLQQASKVWNLSRDEERELRSLKDLLSDASVNHFKNTPHELVRYIKGPRGADQAEETFRGMIQWRKTSDEDIDTMLDDYKPPRALYEYAPSGLLQGVDHDNDPVYLERAGDMDGLGLCQRYSPEDLLTDVVWRRELTASGAWIDDYVAQHGHLPRQINVIYDLKGLSSRHMKKSVGAFFKDAVSYTQDKYYGVSKRMIIIRAPAIFRMVWRVVKTFFRPEVRDKMIFADKDYLSTLDKYMDRTILPPCVYPQGRGQAARGFSPHFDGGLVPADFVDRYQTEGQQPNCNYISSDDACSTGGNTTRTCRSRLDSGSLSLSSDDDGQDDDQQQQQPARRPHRVSVLSRSLLQGSLMLSECGTEFELDTDSLQSVQNLQEAFC